MINFDKNIGWAVDSMSTSITVLDVEYSRNETGNLIQNQKTRKIEGSFQVKTSGKLNIEIGGAYYEDEMIFITKETLYIAQLKSFELNTRQSYLIMDNEIYYKVLSEANWKTYGDYSSYIVQTTTNITKVK